MKTIFPILFSIILFGGLVSSAYAQTELEGSSSVQEHLMIMREKRLEIKEKFQEKRENIREKIATRQAQNRQRVVERIKTVFGKILNRLDAALVRLDKIADRIATRADKLKARGVDTSAAESKLAEAEKAGAVASDAISNAKLAVEAIDASSLGVKDAVHAGAQAVRDTKKALFNYHKALVVAVRELKAAADLREGTDSAR